MIWVAPTLQAFFTDRLITQRNASPETVASYRDTMRLLLAYTHQQTGKQPFELDFLDVDAPLIGAFLTHLETDRGNSPRTRNNRLAAIHSFFRYASLEHPEHAQTIARVMAIPTKRYQRNDICYLDQDEITALLAAPEKTCWLGRRDHALLLTLIQTGLSVSELTHLRVEDLHLGTAAHVRVTGKGRKRRTVTLTRETAAVLQQCLGERQGQPEDPLFPTRQGRSLSRDAVEYLLAKHTNTAAATCPSLTGKRITPHVLPHQRNAAQGSRSRYRHDRPVARPRKHHHHPDLSTCRSRGERSSHRQNRATGRQTRPIPPHRPTPCLPRSTLIMPSTSTPRLSLTRQNTGRQNATRHNHPLGMRPVMPNSV